MSRPKPFVLVTMSGIGVSPILDGNAIQQASMPTWRHLLETYPSALLEASGPAVGLPSWKRCGSPEAGHRTIGLGRTWKTSEARIEAGLATDALASSTRLRKRFRALAKHNGALHLIGLFSMDGSYASRDHAERLAVFAHEQGVQRIYFHLILDGIDAPKDSGLSIVRAFDGMLKEKGIGEIASVCGRYWGMDHDGFWDRTDASFRTIAYGESAQRSTSAEEAIRSSYANDAWDDQLAPTVISSSATKHHQIQDGDAVLFWNARPYGMRQLLKAFSLPTMQSFDRPHLPDILCMTLVEYDYDLPVEVMFPAEQSSHSFGEVVSRSGLRQLRVAEAERFAHVTVFLNGMRERAFDGEDRVNIPSPSVSSYEHAPAMAMADVSNYVIKAVASGAYDVIACNLCAPDIAASTGREDLTIKACESLDQTLRKMVEGILAVGGVLVAVGDSGHAESLRNPLTNEVHKRSTTNPVPCVIVGSAYEGIKAPSGDIVQGDLSLSKPSGTLADIAPTILHILSLPIPKEMTGKSLI